MKPRIAVLFVKILFLLSIGVGSIFLFLENNKLKSQMQELTLANQGFQEKIISVEVDKEKLEKSKEKMEADVVSYLALNTRLQKEKDQLAKAIEDSQKNIENKEAQLQREKKNQEEVEHKLRERAKEDKNKLMKENKELIAKIALSEMDLNSEIATQYYNLGVVYTRSKSYEDAIDSFLKALQIKPDFAEVYYNLGLVYDKIKNNPVKAIASYKKYLEFDPACADKQEVESWIEKLKKTDNVLPEPLVK